MRGVHQANRGQLVIKTTCVVRLARYVDWKSEEAGGDGEGNAAVWRRARVEGGMHVCPPSRMLARHPTSRLYLLSLSRDQLINLSNCPITITTFPVLSCYFLRVIGCALTITGKYLSVYLFLLIPLPAFKST